VRIESLSVCGLNGRSSGGVGVIVTDFDDPDHDFMPRDCLDILLKNKVNDVKVGFVRLKSLSFGIDCFTRKKSRDLRLGSAGGVYKNCTCPTSLESHISNVSTDQPKMRQTAEALQMCPLITLKGYQASGRNKKKVNTLLKVQAQA
jgi:hypothetical protein